MQSEKLFGAMEQFLQGEQGAKFVKQIGAIYRFDVSEKKGSPVTTWILDLKNGNGSLTKGGDAKPDATFTLLDKDLMAMANKTLNPQQAFMQGKMKIKGNMAKATKFTPDLLPPIPKL
ncbi:SCP2 sterol-binding domain [Pseudocohnilembus persalinus]|uniref:SCP2 sterol-binding domain n=1 Tax=Pseudocohnilembus persalinus TaxID=266149 RepID=A0A0V0R3F3_PSEPJ|nr:SCP2 sterol-binding domain [Pseudocohnilembus persalinus]|eukprot:KRX09030.1 SCP2 sterol-binding domain [Pseudocohnilembus persalinus]